MVCLIALNIEGKLFFLVQTDKNTDLRVFECLQHVSHVYAHAATPHRSKKTRSNILLATGRKRFMGNDGVIQ